MRIFLSYSLHESERYIMSILARTLSEQGFFVSANFGNENCRQIVSSHVFIGILSSKGRNLDQVNEDLHYAQTNRIPVLILIEENIPLSPFLEKMHTVIKFNRTTPKQTLDLIHDRIVKAKTGEGNLRDIVAWLIGGEVLSITVKLLKNPEVENSIQN